MLWEKIWEEGVKIAQKETLKKDNEYKIISNLNPNSLATEKDICSPIWIQCLYSALMSNSPSSAFEFWRETGWLKHGIPEIDSFWGRIQNEKYHPEIDVGIHAMMVIDRASFYNLPLSSRLACLFHDLGKSLTELNNPSHINHEINGIPLIKKYIEMWGVDEKTSDIILTVGEHHGNIHTFENRRPQKALKLITDMNLLNRDGDCNSAIMYSIICDDQGRKGLYNSYPRGVFLISECVNKLKSSQSELMSLAKRQLKQREEKMKELNLTPYSEDKKNNMIDIYIHNETLNLISDVFKSFKEKKEDIYDNTIIRNRKSTI